MPHVIVKMYPGRTREQKEELARKITRDVAEVTECKERSISVAIEEIEPDRWAKDVYARDIINAPGKLFKNPGYNPFEEEAAKKEESGHDLMAFVRGRAETAAQEDETGYFNPMSWLDLELEDNPQSFDAFFDTPWDELSDAEKQERATAIRRVL